MTVLELAELSLSNMAKIPKVEALVAHHLRYLANDVINRSADGTERELHLTIKVRPVLDENNGLERVDVAFDAKSKVPVYRTRPLPMAVTRGGFAFNAVLPEELNQIPLNLNE